MVCIHSHGEKKILEGPGTTDWILTEMTQSFPFFPRSCKRNEFEKKLESREQEQNFANFSYMESTRWT